MKQYEFGFKGKVGKAFGGSLLAGKRKTARPISIKKPMHLVMKSTGSFSLCDEKIREIIQAHARKYFIRIYDLTPNWSHVHLTVYFKTRKSYFAFIRTVTAAIVKYLSDKKGISLKGFFDLRPFTRILSWGREMKNMRNYHEINEMESFGMFTRKEKANKNAHCNERRPRAGSKSAPLTSKFFLTNISIHKDL